MKIEKKIFILFIFFLLISCGFKPINSNKNINLLIGQLNLTGDKDAAERIKIKLQKYKTTLKNPQLKIFNIEIFSKRIKSVKTKDTKGNPDVYKLDLTVEFKAHINNQLLIEKTYSEDTTYNAESSESKMAFVEKKLISDLSRIITNRIIFSLQEILNE